MYYSFLYFAETVPVKGKWLLTTVQQKKKSRDVYFVLNFDNNNVLKIGDDAIGTWSVNDNKASLKSSMLKEIEGEYDMSYASNGVLTFSN